MLLGLSERLPDSHVGEVPVLAPGLTSVPISSDFCSIQVPAACLQCCLQGLGRWLGKRILEKGRGREWSSWNLRGEENLEEEEVPLAGN